MRDNITPEEKLLRLIRKEKKPASSVRESKPQTTVKQHIYPSIQKYLSFTYLRKAIMAVFIISCMYLAASLLYPLVGLKKIKLPEITSEKLTEQKAETAQEIKPYEFYLQGVKNRQIFGTVAGQETEKQIASVNVDLIKEINLVGIISGENPQAIIEDKKIQKTYYVTKGQYIGEFQVEDIKEGKVILSFRGQRFELYL